MTDDTIKSRFAWLERYCHALEARVERLEVRQQPHFPPDTASRGAYELVVLDCQALERERDAALASAERWERVANTYHDALKAEREANRR